MIVCDEPDLTLYCGDALELNPDYCQIALRRTQQLSLLA